MFVADGYGNRRVIVLDAGTGAFKRMWGGVGNEPLEADQVPETPADAPLGSPQFGIVHGTEVSNDGLVYVADRGNSRVQCLHPRRRVLDARVRQPGRGKRLHHSRVGILARCGAALDLRADQGNSLIHVIDRKTLEVLESFGSNGAAPGAFQRLHHIATDSEGDIYTAEAQRGRRAQKFTLTGVKPAQ